MGSKHFTALFAFAACVALASPAFAYNVVQDPALDVPADAPNDAVDPNIVAQSNLGAVTFLGAETVTAGYLQAIAAGAITFNGVTSASGAITATSTANGVILTNGALVAGGAVVLTTGTSSVTVGALSVGAPSSITAGQITLNGALTVPSSTGAGVAQLTMAASIGTTATITLNLGATVDPLVAGTRFHVFAWSGPAPRIVTTTLGTVPVLPAGLKYSAADLPVGGDLVVVAACGDHVLDVGETCDDGNVAGGDGCSATCTVEIVDAGTDAGDAGHDAGDAGSDTSTGDGGGRGDGDAALVIDDDGAVPSGSGSGSALPTLGDIFADDDGSSCAFAPGALGAPLPAGAALVALVAVPALLRRRRRPRSRP